MTAESITIGLLFAWALGASVLATYAFAKLSKSNKTIKNLTICQKRLRKKETSH